MRLWHKTLIPYLPKLQLLSQWRECCCICKNIADNGTPNHILVNKIMDYNAFNFWNYTFLIVEEMKRRGYKISTKSLNNFKHNFFKKDLVGKDALLLHDPSISFDRLFWSWHNKRYLRECLFNLEEKAMCNGISKDEWKIIYDKFGKEFDLWEGIIND